MKNLALLVTIKLIYEENYPNFQYCTYIENNVYFNDKFYIITSIWQNKKKFEVVVLFSYFDQYVKIMNRKSNKKNEDAIVTAFIKITFHFISSTALCVYI